MYRFDTSCRQGKHTRGLWTTLDKAGVCQLDHAARQETCYVRRRAAL